MASLCPVLAAPSMVPYRVACVCSPAKSTRGTVEVAEDEEDAAPRRAAARAPSHWTRESANAAKVRAELLRANPSSGRDGRAAYERPSMHGREMVISVGPSSLPSTCRVTRSRIPSANVKWS